MSFSSRRDTDDRKRERNDSFSRGDDRDRAGGRVDHDKPPFSRLFVICSKSHSGDDLKECFEKFGTVEDVWVVKDKHTRENRGVAYVKYSKMSEATLAVEEMDGKPVHESDDRPLKVIIAQPKSSKSTDDQEESALTRVFVSIPKDMDEKELKGNFESFGDIEYTQVVRDRKTDTPKGFGYVKFKKPHDAALAIEGADRSYRAVMADPKGAAKKREVSNDYHSRASNTLNELGLSLGIGSGHRGLSSHDPLGGRGPTAIAEMFAQQSSASSVFGFLNNSSYSGGGRGAVNNKLIVVVSPVVSQDNLGRLFDLIPGMEFCDLKRDYTTGMSKGFASVVYNSIGAAIYAKEKLDGFEYPLGTKLTVTYAQDDSDGILTPKSTPDGGQIDLATALGNANIDLPPLKPLADSEAEAAERLFIVCVPSALQDHVLKDAFCRFGNLIDVYMLKGKNFGYAKFAESASAKNAIDNLNGVEIWGKRLKVMLADPPRSAENARKRPRT